MDNEKLLKAKIACDETGIEIRKSICSICNPNTNCGLNLYVKDGIIIKAEGMPEHKQSNGTLCSKGAAIRQYVYSPDRIQSPMKRVGEKGSGEFENISWEEAYSAISDEFNRLKKEAGPESSAFFVGYPKWMRPFAQRLANSFGSPNYCTESCTCNKSTYMAWKLCYGSLPGPDMANANCLLVWSVNPFYSNTTIAKAIFDRRESGMKMIVVDPRITPMAAVADIHLRLKPGTDGALALGIANVIISEGLYDKDIAEKYTHGFEEYKEYVMTFTPEKAAEITGVPENLIVRAARLYAGTKPAAMMTSSAPVVHHRNGLQNYRAAMLLVALTGNIEVKGGNVTKEPTWYEVTSGYPSRYLEYIAPVKPRNEEKPRTGSKKYPVWMEFTHDAHGAALRQQILSEEPYPITHLMAFGLNHRMWGDSGYTLEALKKLDFFVSADIFLTDACKYADIVLPACTSVERSEWKTYPNGYTLLTTPAIDPLYDSKPDSEIIFELASRLDLDDDLMKKGYEANLDWVFGPSGLTVAELKKHPLGLVPPLTPATYKKYETEGFHTPSGKVECVSEVLKKLQPSSAPLPEYEHPVHDDDYPLTLNTGSRLPMFIHSQTFRLPWTMSLRPVPAADINAADAAAAGISQGDEIFIATPKGRVKVTANISEMALEGAVFMYHGYPDADVNTLIEADNLDPISGFTAFKSLPCKIEKAGDGVTQRGRFFLCSEEITQKEPSPLCYSVDPARCTGCYACVVACMDQNDVDPDTEGVPLVFDERISYPNCPDGMLRFANNGKRPSCESCRVRVENGLLPACVCVCPTKARRFE